MIWAPIWTAVVFAGGLFLGMIVLIEVGRRIGVRRYREDREGVDAGITEVESAVFALLGLLIAFTFSGAAGRFDDRRKLVAREVNAVGTAWLRIDLLPADSQPEIRELFRRYLDARNESYRLIRDRNAALAEHARVLKLQSAIWAEATAALKKTPPGSADLLVIPALNEMFDIVTTRVNALSIHPPAVIFAMLGILSLLSAALAGYAMAEAKTRSWLHVLGFAFVLSVTVYVILDIEYPRIGLIRMDDSDQLMHQLREGMGGERAPVD
jgi:hypothetical protein